jgi:hypothetical protein
MLKYAYRDNQGGWKAYTIKHYGRQKKTVAVFFTTEVFSYFLSFQSDKFGKIWSQY